MSGSSGDASIQSLCGLAVLTLISADAALNTAATAEGLAVDDPNNYP